MKKKILICLMIISSLLSYSQFSKYAGFEDVAALKKTKTYIVLSDSNDIFNDHIKEAIEKEWTITDYEFIQFNELEKYSNSDKYSFIILSGFYASTGGSLKTHTQFYDKKPVTLWVDIQSGVYSTDVVTVQLGGKNFNTFKNWMFFCYAGYGNIGVNSSKMTNYIKLINNSIKLVEDKKLKKLLWNEADELYNTNQALKEKTIVFWENDIPVLTHTGKSDKKFLSKTNIKEKYSGKFEIVNNNELDERIRSSDNNLLFLGTFVEGTFSVIYLYDVNGKIHYFSKMGRMVGECTFWFNAILKKLNKDLD